MQAIFDATLLRVPAHHRARGDERRGGDFLLFFGSLFFGSRKSSSFFVERGTLASIGFRLRVPRVRRVARRPVRRSRFVPGFGGTTTSGWDSFGTKRRLGRLGTEFLGREFLLRIPVNAETRESRENVRYRAREETPASLRETGGFGFWRGPSRDGGGGVLGRGTGGGVLNASSRDASLGHFVNWVWWKSPEARRSATMLGG